LKSWEGKSQGLSYSFDDHQKASVPGLHRATNKRNSEVGTMMSDEGEINYS
jgi:hypothetical protein